MVARFAYVWYSSLFSKNFKCSYYVHGATGSTPSCFTESTTNGASVVYGYALLMSQDPRSKPLSPPISYQYLKLSSRKRHGIGVIVCQVSLVSRPLKILLCKVIFLFLLSVICWFCMLNIIVKANFNLILKTNYYLSTR